MSLRMIAVLLCLFLISQAVADTNTTTQTFEEYIDEKQKKISEKVVDWSYNIDNGLSRWIYNADDEAYCEEQEKILNERFFEDSDISVDDFFKNEKFIEETEKRFVRVRFGADFQSKESTDFNYKIRVQIPLSKTKKNIKLFFDNVERDYFTGDASDEEKTPDVGLSYFSPDYYKLKSKYSIGTSGLNGYLRARYSRAYLSGKWKIEPTQQFKYSIDDGWQEETNVYFDRALEESSLFRTTLHRKTRAHVDGMDYSLGFSYFFIQSKKSGLSLSQSFWGNTKYRTLDKPESYSGISNYSTTVGWRQSIWRKWFAYEIQPGVSFHRQYDYEPNYILKFYVDFYFGNI
ncbi:MAG: hypothetical protein OQK48_01525 [Sulfurimonas sp.]|nr:hypothetical protein [Sulfurimonas sp.]